MTTSSVLGKKDQPKKNNWSFEAQGPVRRWYLASTDRKGSLITQKIQNPIPLLGVEICNCDALASPSNQTIVMENDRKTTGFVPLFSPQAKLQSLQTSELKLLNNFDLKCAKMLGINITLAEEVDIASFLQIPPWNTNPSDSSKRY